jgi:predicted RND superfamily exporter protein
MHFSEAVVEAGRTRLRPIMMTTIAMVFGMLPIALATGTGSEWKNGLAWALIGGLTSSMLLTVFLVPVVTTTVNPQLRTAVKLRHLADALSNNWEQLAAIGTGVKRSLAATIVKHIPKSYSITEADKYAAEYIQAMADIKAESSAKSNLWDRFLNILAGVVPFEQSPVERVMMQRWIDGERGEL